METVIRGIKRPLSINGTDISDVDAILSILKEGTQLEVRLSPVNVQPAFTVYGAVDGRLAPEQSNSIEVGKTYVLKVRQYMTNPATPEFDFMDKYNKESGPMPFRIMECNIIRETRGMYLMNCKVVPMRTDTCMRCGRRLTHPVSRLYGVGPECGGHAHINPFETEQELNAALNTLTLQLANITWNGWVIKSAIEEFEEVK